MAWSARVETVSLGAGDTEIVLAAATLSGAGAAAVLSSPAPAGAAVDGVAARLETRVQVLAGAVIAACGAAPVATESAGLRLQSRQGHVFRVKAGDRVAFIEGVAGDAPNFALAGGDSHIGQVGGESVVAVAAFSRPAGALAYAAGQLAANSATPASVTPLSLAVARKNGGAGMVRRLRLSSSAAASLGASFRVHLFRTAPVSTAGDGGVFAGAVNGVAASHLGHADVTLDLAFSDGAKGVAGPACGSEILFDCAAGSTAIHALIEARGPWAAAAGETLTLALEVLRD
jgi:hypothetical protein